MSNMEAFEVLPYFAMATAAPSLVPSLKTQECCRARLRLHNTGP